MELEHILKRTPRGAQELQTRSGELTSRQRAILLLVNGERSAAAILAQLHSAGPDADDIARLLTEGYVQGLAPARAMPPEPKPAKPVKPAAAPAAVRHVRQAAIADWRLGQAGAFSALQRYLEEGPQAPLDFLNGLAAPLYAALSTCRSEAFAHAVAAVLEGKLDEADRTVTEAP